MTTHAHKPAHTTHATHKTTHASAQKDQSGIIFTVLAVIVVLLTLYIGFFKKDAVRMETMKVGGAENFALVQQLYGSEDYKTQQTAMINQVLETTVGDDQEVVVETEDEAETVMPEGNQIEKSAIEQVKKGAYIQGDENARITIVEYAEFLCPFCKRQHDQRVLEQVLEKFPNDVNRIYKHYIVHGEPAKIVGEAAECAGDQGGNEAYYNAVTEIFATEDKSQAGLTSVAKALKLNVDKFEDCLEEHTFGASIDAQTNEGRSLFGVNGTPGNVVIDNEKGTWTLIAGAYPVEEFIKVVEGILAN